MTSNIVICSICDRKVNVFNAFEHYVEHKLKGEKTVRFSEGKDK